MSIVLALLLSITYVSTSQAMTGNDWNGFSDSERVMYVSGVVDDWKVTASLLGEQEEPTSQIIALRQMAVCLKEMTYEQMNAIVKKYIVKKYMASNPEQWHRTMSFLVWVAMRQACMRQ